MLDTRKQDILKLIVENYTQTAEPVGSKFLVEQCGLDVSGATARNDMRELEELGYLTHPHTSSGRIPTEAGYAYYVEHIMKPKKIGKKVETELKELAQETDDVKQRIKFFAKYSAEKTQSATIVAFGEDFIYYTGLSYLFSQPEFRDYAHVARFSTIFDQVDERIGSIYELFESSTPQVILGQKNPFGAMCGLVGGKLDSDILFVTLGPVRMDYATNYSFVDYLQKSI